MSLRRFFEEIPSTQAEALRLAREGAPAGTFVVAARQSAGTGRAGHSWSSPDGGLYLSVIVALPAHRPGVIPLALGERLRQHFEEAYGVRSVLKWPNDLLIPTDGGPHRKLAGVLVDRVDERSAVVGVGVNVAVRRADLPPELRDRVAILRELTSYPPEVAQVESEALEVVHSTLELLESDGGRRAILAACRRSLYGRGHAAQVDGRPVGVIRDLGEEGELWVDGDQGPQAVWAGDLTIEEQG
ncbi:MAG TPA: biotin--[acetyl-CoA-carboxylase] ligase [Thermoplasmata archaeon]|nr:biotin--[acetyl-CoA-carboxylase] ligase [Thermoplasmata archaeon]